MRFKNAIYNAVFKLEEDGHRKEAKDLVICYLEAAQRMELATTYGEHWYEMDINPSAIVSGE